MTEAAGQPAATIVFTNGVFALDAIKRAAYRFIDRVSVEIVPGEVSTACLLRPLNAKRPLDFVVLENEFRNEVLDQDLRLKIAAETEPYRNLVLSLAFSKTSMAQ